LARRTILPEPDFRRLFESAPGLYLVLLPDPHFSIIAVSDAYARATLIERDQVLGKGLFEAFPDNPNDPEASGVSNLRDSLLRVVRGKVPDAMAVQKYDIRKPEEQGGGFEERYWSPVNSPVFGEGGALCYIIHRVEDVTEFMRLKKCGTETSKALQDKVEKAESEVYARAQEIQVANRNLRDAHEQLKRLFRRVKELDEIKTQFFANVSHELRTPLALILGPVQQLLSESALSESQREMLDVVARNATTLLHHVNDLLDVAKLEAGKMSLNYAAVDLAKLLRIAAAHFETVLQTKGVTFHVEAPETLPVQIDEEKIQRVVMNLLSNAFKFVPAGGWIHLSVQAIDGHAVVRVADNGPGVSPALRAAIFERFRQGEAPAGSRGAGGTGLGLAIAKDFVELHHGTISVKDTPGGGATFLIELPVKAPEGVEVRSANRTDLSSERARAEILSLRAQLAPAPAAAAPSTAHGGQPLALVVEDNPDMREFIAITLRSDFRVALAENGEEGLARALELKPDVILSDVMMPRMTGDRLIAELRKHRDFDSVPVILLTARADDELKFHLLGTGCQDYLTKPFSPEELRVRARNWASVKLTREILSRELSSRSGDLTTLAQDLARKKQDLQIALDSLLVAKRQAEQANEAKTYFLNMISHELNTPLTSLLMTLQLISRRGLQVGEGRDFDRILSASNRLKELIETLLQYSRAESGKLQVDPSPIDLAKLARELLEEVTPLARGKGLRLVLDDVPATSPFRCDPRLLRLVLNNLLTNAIKYTERGEVRLTLGRDDGHLHASVRDTGVGIAREDQSRIFEPFVQLGTWRERASVAGVGLGLTLVAQVVGALGGQIHVESEPGKGSAFRVRIPEARRTRTSV
jgi:signal transduction histidine kinase